MTRTELRSAGLIALLAAFAAPAAASAQQDATGLNDAQIAHIAVTANAIDVELAELAGERAADERVRSFAARMVTDHTGVNEQAVALAGRLDVTPQDNDVSRGLRQGAAEARKSLESAARATFDRAYMEHEVAYHGAVLAALDDTLIPNTANAELRALLEQARGAVAAHLAHAQDLSKALASTP